MGFVKNFLTYLRQEKKGNYMVITLYETDICKITDKKFLLNSGGHETQTTNRALNFIALEYNLPFKAVYSKGNITIISKAKRFRLADNQEYEIQR